MNNLNFAGYPELKESIMIAAWEGEPNAGSGATQAITTIAEQLKVHRLANIDSEPFFQFTSLRPRAVNKGGKQQIVWPTGRFFYHKSGKSGEHDIILFLGEEPHLLWRTYCDVFAKVASACDTQLLITVGSSHFPVPHTVKPPVTVTANAKLSGCFSGLYFPDTAYEEEPLTIASIVAERFLQSEIPCIKVWGSSPDYLDLRYNPGLTIALIEKLQLFLPHQTDISELVEHEKKVRNEADQYVDDDDELQAHMRKLEERYIENPNEKMLIDVERYLNQVRLGYYDDDEGDDDVNG